MTFDWAIQITNMGTFFLKLSTDLFGDLTGLVLMVGKAKTAKSYDYRLCISCCEQHDETIHCGTVNNRPNGLNNDLQISSLYISNRYYIFKSRRK